MAGETMHKFNSRWDDAHSIPTTAFQQSMLAVIYLVAAIALVFYGLRMWARIVQKQVGLGTLILTQPCNIYSLTILEDWLITGAVVSMNALDVLETRTH